jgi:hypothetical protein
LERLQNRRISQQEPLHHQPQEAKQEVMNQTRPGFLADRADAFANEIPDQQQHRVADHGAAKSLDIVPCENLIKDFTRGSNKEPQQDENQQLFHVSDGGTWPNPTRNQSLGSKTGDNPIESTK